MREDRIVVRVTEEEKKHFFDAAKKKGLTISAYARMCMIEVDKGKEAKDDA